jgi:hypothetical protein
MPKKSIHEVTRNGTKMARMFVGFLREVWCGFVDKIIPRRTDVSYLPATPQLICHKSCPAVFPV